MHDSRIKLEVGQVYQKGDEVRVIEVVFEPDDARYREYLSGRLYSVAVTFNGSFLEWALGATLLEKTHVLCKDDVRVLNLV